MEFAGTKFKILKDKGSWAAPTREEETLLSLQSRVDALNTKFKARKIQKIDDKSTKVPQKKGKFVGEKRKFTSPYKKPTEPRPNWLKQNQEPSQAELKKSKQWGEIPYYWCSPATGGKCDGCWRQHLPAKCEGTAKPVKKKNKPEKHVTINETIVAIEGGYESD